MTSTPSALARRALAALGRRTVGLLPATVLSRAATGDSRLGALARRNLGGRANVVQRGVGRGLLFDPGASNPEYAVGTNEPAVQDLFARTVRPGMVVYDVGANVGFFSVLAARLCGAGGAVYAFEPDLDNARLARANLAANDFGQALVIARAVGPSTGVSTLQVARYSGGHALAGAEPPPDKVHEVPVETVSLDDFIAQDGVRPPDFVKIDVEGYELPVLEGMVGLLEAHRPSLLVELDDATRSGHDAKAAALRARLEELGYRVSELADSYGGIDWVVSHWHAIPVGAAEPPAPDEGEVVAPNGGTEPS